MGNGEKESRSTQKTKKAMQQRENLLPAHITYMHINSLACVTLSSRRERERERLEFGEGVMAFRFLSLQVGPHGIYKVI